MSDFWLGFAAVYVPMWVVVALCLVLAVLKSPDGWGWKSCVSMSVLCGALWPMVILAVFYESLRELREEVQP